MNYFENGTQRILSLNVIKIINLKSSLLTYLDGMGSAWISLTNNLSKKVYNTVYNNF